MRRLLADGGDLERAKDRLLAANGGGDRRLDDGGSSYSNFCGEKSADAVGVAGRLPEELGGTRIGGGGGLARCIGLWGS